jgi:hypothetical protein
MARIRALLPLVALAACGVSPSFEGTFIGTVNAEPVTLILQEDGKTLSGTIRFGGVEAKVSANFEGERMTGIVRQPDMGFEAPFEATLKGDTIDWVYTFTDEFGQKNRLPLFLTREGKAPKVAEERNHLDPQLVGRWHRDVTGAAVGGKTVTTRVRRALNADGTFEYGGAESSPGGSGPEPVTRGQWKTEGQVLYSRETGQGQWISLGRYVVSGSDLVMYPGDGSKQLWSRE